MNEQDLWQEYRRWLWWDPALGMTVDASRMGLDDAFLEQIRPAMDSAFAAMDDLERGAIANPDENRRVGHYWLRDPESAPEPSITDAIRDMVTRVRSFARAVHEGTVAPQRAERFTSFLLVGIGGSALGPQFVSDALGGVADRMRAYFLDNTDPDGMDRVLAALGEDLASTLTVVVSKSGSTRETRNGMLETAEAYRRRGLDFARHAVAVTGTGSALERRAREDGFLDMFPMWDWVGGRTSVLSAVGLLPAALQGLDTGGLLAGAKAMDERTRRHDPQGNPAALLAASWYRAGNGRGERDMVILPYKDRLLLFGRYLQQLVMESLGKEKDLDGKVVHQGLVVYGNKGSTDQHAYVQQLRDGPDNFFVTFLQVLRDREGPSPVVDADTTSGDYLMGFLWGTREALSRRGRASLTITLPELSARTVGMLIALYERAVGLYAGLIRVNAYHQPGVEAGKKAAEEVLALQRRALAVLREEAGKPWTLGDLARRLETTDLVTLWKVLEHAAANPDHGVLRTGGEAPGEGTFSATG